MKYTLDIKKVLSGACNLLKAQWKFLLPVVFFAWMFSTVASFGVDPQGPFGLKGPDFMMPLYYAFGLASYLFLSLLVSIGLMSIFIDTVDGKELQRSDMLEGFTFKKMFSFIVAYIIYTILVVVGMILLIIPGVFIAVALIPLFYVIVDKNMGPIEAIKEAYALTKGHWWHVLAITILTGIIALVVMILLGVLFLVGVWLGSIGGAVLTVLLLIVGIPFLLLAVLFIQTYIGLTHAYMYKELRDHKADA